MIYFFGRCHYVKIWQTNASGEYVLVRDYVPCLKDGMAGMYDNVSHTISYPVGRPFGYELVGAAVRAVWNGSDANAILPGNWLCYDSASALIANAVPSSGTAVTVDRADPAPTVVDGSTLSWSATTIGGSAAGKVAQTGGSLNLMSGTLGANEGSQGTYEASGGSLVSGDFFLGQPGTGTINANGSASMQFSKLYIGNTRGGKGYINIGGDASITISGYSTLGQSAGSYGEVNQTGGTVTTGTHGEGFNIGRDGIGTYNLSGGTLNVRQLLRVGWGGGTSECVFNMSGDSTLNLSNALSVGDWAKNCQFNMTGGTITGHKLYIGGYSGNSTGSGAFVQDGGDVVLDDTIIIGSAKGTGSYTMNGGKITEKWWIQLGQDNVGTFTQNGVDIVLQQLRQWDIRNERRHADDRHRHRVQPWCQRRHGTVRDDGRHGDRADDPARRRCQCDARLEWRSSARHGEQRRVHQEHRHGDGGRRNDRYDRARLCAWRLEYGAVRHARHDAGHYAYRFRGARPFWRGH